VSSAYVDAWRSAAQAGDAKAAVAAMAEDVELVSPITDQFTFEGRAELERLLTSVFEVFKDIRFEVQSGNDRHVFVKAAGRVGKLRLEEMQYLELDDEGRIRRLTLMMRPLTSVTRFLRLLGPRVARRQGQRRTAGVLTVAGAFLDSVASSGDRVFLPMASPERVRRQSGRLPSRRSRRG
jgi:SnoaL-like domain